MSGDIPANNVIKHFINDFFAIIQHSEYSEKITFSTWDIKRGEGGTQNEVKRPLLKQIRINLKKIILHHFQKSERYTENDSLFPCMGYEIKQVLLKKELK